MSIKAPVNDSIQSSPTYFKKFINYYLLLPNIYMQTIANLSLTSKLIFCLKQNIFI